MANDRRTGIDGDQISDKSITKDEVDIINEPVDKQSLGWDAANQKFKWYYASDVANRLDYYQESENESSTTSANWQDKIVYTTPNVIAGVYEFWYYAEINKSNNQGTIQKVRLIVDNIEICFNIADANIQDWRGTKGFKRMTFETSGVHVIKVQFASGTSGKTMSIRRARIRVLSIGI